MGPNPNHLIDIRLSTFHLTTNFVIAQVETGPEKPNQIALMVKKVSSYSQLKPDMFGLLRSINTNMTPAERAADWRARSERMRARREEEQADWNAARWIPFAQTLPIDLGPGEGGRMIWIAGKWSDGEMRANGTHVTVDQTPPIVTITNPTVHITSQPMIQLQGYTDEDLQSIRYDVVRPSNSVSNEQGHVNSRALSADFFAPNTNYFTCYDIDLEPGTNRIVLRCQDYAGNTSTNIYTYVLNLEQDKIPPMISLDSPRPGARLSGQTFTARGRLDDPTAQINAVISAKGVTNKFDGLVERNGYFWVEDIPLTKGENQVRLTATDAAGNASQTNFTVQGSGEVLVIDPVSPELLWRHTVTVTGKVRPADHRVWVNGVQATVKADGTWVALQVPTFSPNGGTVVFEVTALPPSASTNAPPAKANEVISVAADLGTNVVTLNAGRPACGRFDLDLSGAAGRSFILQASTNLIDWSPILTNLNSRPTFHFSDTSAEGYPCRFFRVVPVP